MKFVAATRPKGWKIAAEAIMLIDGAEYSHIIMIEDDGQLVYQASHGFVNVWHIDNFLEENEIIHLFDWECFDDRWIKKQLGKKYSKFQLLWILIFKIFGFKLGSNGDRKFICSEFAGKGMGIPTDDYTTPKYIVEYLLSKRKEGNI